ncbi:MAG: hypothetical protein ACPGOY_04230 [Rhodospirillaceae bacterium]
MLTYKIGGAMVTVIVLALCLTTLLNYLRFEETYSRLVENRLSIVAAEVAETAVTGIDLGLPLTALETLPPAMERQMARDPEITGVLAHDCSFAPVAQVGVVPEELALTDALLQRDRWRFFTDEIVAVGRSFTDSLGDCAGGVAVFHSPDAYVASRDAALDRMIRGAAISAAVALPAVLLVSGVFMGRRRALRSLEVDLANVALGKAEAEPDQKLVAQTKQTLPELSEAYLAARPVLLEMAQKHPPEAEGAGDSPEKPDGHKPDGKKPATSPTPESV